jgi:hypothetical protein
MTTKVMETISGQWFSELRARLLNPIGEQIEALDRELTFLLDPADDLVPLPARKEVAEVIPKDLEQYRDYDRDEVPELPYDPTVRAGLGQGDAIWVAMCELVRELHGIELEGLDEFITLTEAGRWWPFENIVVISERPAQVERDEEGRFHSETGPAVMYRDGFEFWAWRGIRVPSRAIEEPATVEKVLREPNAEIRRVMVERFGPDRFMKESGAKMIQKDEYGELWQKNLGVAGEDPIVMVKVIDSTEMADGSRREYFLRVPFTIRTAKEAVAWTFDMDPDEYDPEVET